MDTKTLSIVGLVLSFIVPIAGLIISAVCLNKYKQEGVTDGKGLAVAGLIISIVFMAISFISIGCFACTGCLAAASSGY